MRSPMLIAYLVFMTSTATADDELTVLRDGPDGGSPRTMLSKFLQGGGGEGLRRPPQGGGRAEDARRRAQAPART